MNSSVKPPKLKKGDTVGIISPSSPITEDLMPQFHRGIKTLEEFGLKPKIGKHTFDKHFYSAGTRENRINDLNDMWDDPEVDMILMALGGGSALQLVDGLDYDTIKKHPKILSGISDGTILLNAINAKTNLVTFHGPDLLFTFGREITPLIRENITRAFFDGKIGKLKQNSYWKNQTDPTKVYSGWKWLREGTATGQLVGGNTNCFIKLEYSGYGPDIEDKILFLEGTGFIHAIDQQFISLRLHGVFERIAGLIIGWFDGHDMPNKNLTRSVADTILEITENYSFPILEIGELGHNVENYVLPIGCQATIDSTNNSFIIQENVAI